MAILVPATSGSDNKGVAIPILWTLIPAMAPIIAVIGIVAFDATNSTNDYKRKLLEAYKLIEEEGLGKLEPLGREYASAKYARVSIDTDVKLFYRRLVKFYNDVSKSLDLAMSKWPRDKDVALYVTVSRLWSAFTLSSIDIDYISMILEQYLTRATIPVFRKDPLIKIIPRDIVEAIAEKLVNIEWEQMRITNKKCIWIFGKVENIDNYTFAGLINDVTACTHTLLDYARMTLDPELKEFYREIYVKRPNSTLLEGALGWRIALTKLWELGVVEDSDYAPTRAIVIENRAELVVGSSPGHTVHAEISDNNVVVTYYDKDEDVHRVLMAVAEKLGVNVVKHEEKEYTTFSVPANKYYLIFKCILPFATSLDIRISYLDTQRRMWGVLSVEDVRNIQMRYNYNIIDTEVHLILDAIKTLKLDRA